MVKQFLEPRENEADFDDWLRLIKRTTAQAGGFISLGLANIDNSDAPLIEAGSRLEINGAVYFVEHENEPITGTAVNGRNFIYAEPSGETVIFKYDNAFPAWNAAKGGWYKPNTQERAVATFDFNGGNYNTKIILDNFNAMNNPSIRLPNWQRGFLQLVVPGMEGLDPPIIMAGSIIELDGILYEIGTETSVSGLLSEWRDTFIIARQTTGNLEFSFWFFPGQWNHERQGWYVWAETPTRMIMKGYANASRFNGKVILDSQISMSVIPNHLLLQGHEIFSFNHSMGNSVSWNSASALGQLRVAPGMYMYQIRGASSGQNIGRISGGRFVWHGDTLEYGIGQRGAGSGNGAGGGGMTFLGPVIAHGGRPGASGHNAGGIYGGMSSVGASPPNTTDAYIRLWRCW